MNLPVPLGLLLLEDSPADSRLLVESLRERVQDGSLVIQTVRRLADALRELKRFRFSCVLVDLGLPDGQGVANVARIREADPDVAIVVLTGLNDQGAAEEAFRLGAQDYLIKGERLGEELLRFVEQAVLKRASRREPVVAAGSERDATVLQYRPWVDPTRNRFCGIDCVNVDAWRPGQLAGAVASLVADVVSWREAGLNPGPISLRMPADAWLRASEEIHATMVDTALTPEQVCLRVPASAFGPRTPALDGLQRLRGAGFQVWLQDWSAQSAPLDALCARAWDGLVLDLQGQSAPIDNAARRFLGASHAAGAALGIALFVEGVEHSAWTSTLPWLAPHRVGGDLYCAPQTASVLPLRWRRGPVE